MGYYGDVQSEGVGAARCREISGGIGRAVIRAGDRMLRLVLAVNVVLIAASLISPYKVLVIRSDSMEPVLPVGSIVIAERVRDVSELRVGDIVTYKNPAVPFTITHRIVEVTKEGFVTKGDNLEEADGIVKREWVKYRIKLILLE